MVFANVTDRTGSPVPNLTAADLEVTVEGVKQSVTRVTVGEPMRIILLVDSSQGGAPQLTSFRAGLKAFLDALPAEDEVGVFSTGGQGRARQAPTTDRQKLHAVADDFTSDGGSNALVDALLVSDKRFFKNALDRWPVLVILTSDPGTTGGVTELGAFNTFARDFAARGGVAHAMVVHGQASGPFFSAGSFATGSLISELVSHLVETTGGVYDPIAIGTSVPDKMKALAARIAADHERMADRYKIEYTGEAKATQQVEVRMSRDGVTIQLSSRRPF